MTCTLPFRYPGGKFYALPKLRPFWKNFPHCEYREPFVGGGAVFFDKTRTDFDWLNDADHELITTYHVIQDQSLSRKLIEELKKEEPTKERWNYYFRIFKPANDFEVAKRYYFLNRVSFSGKLAGAAYGYRPKRSVPPSRWNEKIIPSGLKLNNVKITCGDFEKVISEPSDREVLMFIDPPYITPNKNKHYRIGFDYEDHLRLMDVLKKTPHKFFLTYERDSRIMDLYSWANIYNLDFTYRVGDSNQNLNKCKIGNEIVVTNLKGVIDNEQ